MIGSPIFLFHYFYSYNISILQITNISISPIINIYISPTFNSSISPITNILIWPITNISILSIINIYISVPFNVTVTHSVHMPVINILGPKVQLQYATGMLILVLVLVLKDSLRTFSSPCPGPWGQVLVLVFSPCKDLFPLFHYSDLFAYYCSANAYN